MHSKLNFRVPKNPLPSCLRLNDEQRQRLGHLTGLFDSKAFGDATEEQSEAAQYLTDRDLSFQQLELATSKWKVQDNDSSRASSLLVTKVYQCASGHYWSINTSRKQRRQYPFVGCLAFARITTEKKTGRIKNVFGFFEHSPECTSAKAIAPPPLFLHPVARNQAESLLTLGLTTSDVLAKNRKLVSTRFNSETIIEDKRLLLTAFDVCNIRAYLMKKNWGINLRNRPEDIVDDLFGENSTDAALREATIFYKPRTGSTDRFELVIASPKQREYAWKYGNNKMIFVDGTFGVSKKKLLAFVLVIDDENKGIPVGFIIFSAPDGNMATHAGYDADILIKLFTEYRDGLQTFKKEKFEPKVKRFPHFMYL